MSTVARSILSARGMARVLQKSRLGGPEGACSGLFPRTRGDLWEAVNAVGLTGFQPVIAEPSGRPMIPSEINELPPFRVSYWRMGQAHAGGRTHAPKGVCCNGPYARVLRPHYTLKTLR